MCSFAPVHATRQWFYHVQQCPSGLFVGNLCLQTRGTPLACAT